MPATDQCVSIPEDTGETGGNVRTQNGNGLTEATMPCNEFLKRNAGNRIAGIKKKYGKRFIHPFYGISFSSSNYQKLPNGYYAIYDNPNQMGFTTVSYTHLRAHETRHDLVCRLLLEKK